MLKLDDITNIAEVPLVNFVSTHFRVSPLQIVQAAVCCLENETANE